MGFGEAKKLMRELPSYLSEVHLLLLYITNTSVQQEFATDSIFFNEIG